MGLVALTIASLWAAESLSEADWDPTLFAAFGEEATPTREYAEELLGPVILRPKQGHDGKFFFVQANDPLLLEPEANAQVLDLPLYRSQRMLYPLLAGGAGLFRPDGVVWGMLVVNLLAIGAGSAGLAEVARAMGGTCWWGLAFVLNLGFFSEIVIGGAGVVAAAAAFWALAFLYRDAVLPAAALFGLSALSREVMLIAPLGAAIWLWREKRRFHAAAVALVPLAAVATWAVYLRFRLGFDSGLSEVQGIGLPFVGVVRAFDNWMTDFVDLAAGFVVLLLLALYTIRTFRSPSLLAFTFLGFVPLTILLNELVWNSYFDITRAVAPIITAFVLMMFLSESDSVSTGQRTRTSLQERRS